MDKPMENLAETIIHTVGIIALIIGGIVALVIVRLEQIKRWN